MPSCSKLAAYGQHSARMARPKCGANGIASTASPDAPAIPVAAPALSSTAAPDATATPVAVPKPLMPPISLAAHRESWMAQRVKPPLTSISVRDVVLESKKLPALSEEELECHLRPWLERSCAMAGGAESSLARHHRQWLQSRGATVAPAAPKRASHCRMPSLGARSDASEQSTCAPSTIEATLSCPPSPSGDKVSTDASESRTLDFGS